MIQASFYTQAPIHSLLSIQEIKRSEQLLNIVTHLLTILLKCGLGHNIAQILNNEISRIRLYCQDNKY